MNMYVKCYSPIFNGENTRRAFLNLKTAKEKVDSDLEQAKKKINYLESELREAKKKEKANQNTLKEETKNKEASIQATIDAKNICFQREQKHTDNAMTAVTKAKEAQGKLEEQNSNLKQWAEVTEEQT